LHVGIDILYHPTRYHKKIVEFVLGGGVLCVTINNGGLSIADEISFFRIFKYIRFSRPRTVWGGNATHNIMLFKQQSAIIFLEQSSSLSSHNNKHDGSLGYSNNLIKSLNRLSKYMPLPSDGVMPFWYCRSYAVQSVTTPPVATHFLRSRLS
jgi:hypothetical protein